MLWLSPSRLTCDILGQGINVLSHFSAPKVGENFPLLNTCMRYKEIYKTSPAALSIYNPNKDHSKPAVTDTRKSALTLRHLNRLKHIRRKRQRDHDAKMELVSIMYGDPQLRENELEVQQQALENLKDEIANKIDAAEINQKQKSHIEDMAINALTRKRKK